MLNQFLTWTFFIEMVVAVAVGYTYYRAAGYFHKGVAQRSMKADYLRVPTNNVLVIVGLLVPVLLGLLIYLDTNTPTGTYSSLAATVVLLFLILIFAIWETFAILKIADDTDKITLNIAGGDLSYIIGMGLMFSLLIIALVYFAIFLLFELKPVGNSRVTTTTGINNSYYLAKPKLEINQSKDSVIKLWGEPANVDSTGTQLYYELEQSELLLKFDSNAKLQEITETRRKP